VPSFIYLVIICDIFKSLTHAQQLKCILVPITERKIHIWIFFKFQSYNPIRNLFQLVLIKALYDIVSSKV